MNNAWHASKMSVLARSNQSRWLSPMSFNSGLSGYQSPRLSRTAWTSAAPARLPATPCREPDVCGNAARGAGVPAAERVGRDISERFRSGAETVEAGTADAGWDVETGASCALDAPVGAEEEEAEDDEAEDDDWVREMSMNDRELGRSVCCLYCASSLRHSAGVSFPRWTTTFS
jgi:hypothetical protein